MLSKTPFVLMSLPYCLPSRLILPVLLMFCSCLAQAEVQVIDDTGRHIRLDQPARRIISLAPHVTEGLFNAGAGDKVVGVVSYSDYPPEATRLPLVGSYDRLDLEQILALRPDLIVGWKSGNPQAALEQLQQLGIPVYLSEPHDFSDIPSNLLRLGVLAGTDEIAVANAQQFVKDLKVIQQRYLESTERTVFYQVWREPLMTFNGEHLFNRILHLCGGRNLFADLPRLASSLDLEAVLKANPEVIIVGETNREWLDDWRRWPMLQAVKTDQLYALNQDVLVRPTIRVLDGIRQLCTVLQPQL